MVSDEMYTVSVNQEEGARTDSPEKPKFTITCISFLVADLSAGLCCEWPRWPSGRRRWTVFKEGRHGRAVEEVGLCLKRLCCCA